MSHKYINFCIQITNLPSIRSTQFRRKFLLIHDTASHTPELSRKHVVRLWSAVQPARIHRFYINVGRRRWNETNERNKFSVPSLATRNTLNRDERVENEKLSSPLSLFLSLCLCDAVSSLTVKHSTPISVRNLPDKTRLDVRDRWRNIALFAS